jgi:hypothetical protein
VPERESFGGEGGHYLATLSLVSLAGLVLLGLYLAFQATRSGASFATTWRRFAATPWVWLDALLMLLPLATGAYYWYMLREEEVVVTDEAITRSSRWGEETLPWSAVRAFHKRPILFRQTRIGRISGLSRYFARSYFTELTPICYELWGPPGADGEPQALRLEPGTIDDLPWLLKLIGARVGPPTEE